MKNIRLCIYAEDANHFALNSKLYTGFDVFAVLWVNFGNLRLCFKKRKKYRLALAIIIEIFLEKLL